LLRVKPRYHEFESCRESVTDIFFLKLAIKTPDPILSTVVANEFNAEFNITASSGQDALLVVNATSSNNFAVYSYLESGSRAEIQGTELTLIGVFNANGDAVTSQFNFI
jgi:hypothetical protein